MTEKNLGGAFTFPGTELTVSRMGYGAMQLAGQDGEHKRVWGPPKDVPGALAVLREAIASGVNHIDTSDFYGPHVTNQLIKQALHPYPDNLVLVTKVGAKRGANGEWIFARSAEDVTDAVHDNLRNLGLDALDVVNLRLGGLTGPVDEPFEEPLTALAGLKLALQGGALIGKHQPGHGQAAAQGRRRFDKIAERLGAVRQLGIEVESAQIAPMMRRGIVQRRL